MSKNQRFINSEDLYKFCEEAMPSKITGAYTKGEANALLQVKSAARNPEALKGADVEPIKSSHWEIVPGTCGAHRCAACKAEALYRFSSAWSSDCEECLTPKCPWCGAHMK